MSLCNMQRRHRVPAMAAEGYEACIQVRLCRRTRDCATEEGCARHKKRRPHDKRRDREKIGPAGEGMTSLGNESPLATLHLSILDASARAMLPVDAREAKVFELLFEGRAGHCDLGCMCGHVRDALFARRDECWRDEVRVERNREKDVFKGYRGARRGYRGARRGCRGSGLKREPLTARDLRVD
ncbi:hypothetical protein POSPLADRAFT_1068912, partial [Postia placenta MAD-698-R-SB12]